MSTTQILALVAAEENGGGGAALLQFGILLLIPFGLYFLMIRPQRRRMREQQDLQRSIQVGDEIVTTSGIYGTITGEDGDQRFWLEIDDDVQIRIARAAIHGKADPDGESEKPGELAESTTADNADTDTDD